MSRAQKGLLSGEEIIYTTKLHWNTFMVSALLVIFISLPAVYGYFALQFKYKIIFIGVALVPLAMFFINYVIRNASEFVVTNKRVVIYLGVLSSRSFEIMLSKIESVAVDQNLIGKLFNFGLLTVGGTGGSKETFSNIQNPFEFRKKVEEQMEKASRA